MKRIEKCILCESREITTLYQKIKNNFNIDQCQECGLAFTNPQPSLSELDKMYQKEKVIFSGSGEKELKKLKKIKKIYDRLSSQRLCVIEKYQRKGKLLDIGSGGGFFLAYARERDWQVDGLELSQWGVTVAKKIFQINVFQGDLMQANYPNNSYDVVTMYDVLEHIINPLTELKEVYRILKPGGLLIVNVPNFNSFFAKLNKNHWSKLDPPQHLWHFAPDTLSKIITKSGFNVLEQKTGVGSAEESSFSFATGLATAVSEKSMNKFISYYRQNKDSLQWLLKLLKNISKILSYIFGLPLLWLTLLLDRGEGITVYAKKSN